MSYRLSWLVDNRLLYTKIWNEYTLDELVQVEEEGKILIRNGTPLVHLLIDFRLMTEYPSNLREIVARSSVFREPNAGWVVVLTNNRMVQFLTSIVAGVSQARFRAFDSWDSALKFLVSIDSAMSAVLSLPDQGNIPEA